LAVFAVKADQRKSCFHFSCHLSRLFLWRADTRSGFNNSIRRMQCDHKPLDFYPPQETPSFITSALVGTNPENTANFFPVARRNLCAGHAGSSSEIWLDFSIIGPLRGQRSSLAEPKGLNRHIRLAAFNFAHMSSVQAGTLANTSCVNFLFNRHARTFAPTRF